MTDPQRIEHRVIFDFEVDFSNGGGLQGQEFRLDIDGESISDEELAAFLIRDLSLLMVSDVRIVRKETIREQHKRRRPAPAGVTTGNGHLVDLSHSVEDGMVTYRGLPAPVICDFLRGRSGHRSRTLPFLRRPWKGGVGTHGVGPALANRRLLRESPVPDRRCCVVACRSERRSRRYRLTQHR
jgi:hypothetical protein